MGVVDYPVVVFVRFSSINVATDMIGGLGEVDSGRVWQFGNQRGLSDYLFIFPFPAFNAQYCNCDCMTWPSCPRFASKTPTLSRIEAKRIGPHKATSTKIGK